jgi:DNA gyrase inhibitor GyrI
VRGNSHINGIEGFWGMAKTRLVKFKGMSRSTFYLDDLESYGFKVKIRSLPKQRLAYIRVHDSYSSFSRINDAYYRLLAWYRQRGGSLDNVLLYGMSQDNPDVTPLQLCRFDWCVKVPADWKGDPDVDVTDFPACRVAALRCVGDFGHENAASDGVTESGYVLAVCSHLVSRYLYGDTTSIGDHGR